MSSDEMWEYEPIYISHHSSPCRKCGRSYYHTYDCLSKAAVAAREEFREAQRRVPVVSEPAPLLYCVRCGHSKAFHTDRGCRFSHRDHRPCLCMAPREPFTPGDEPHPIFDSPRYKAAIEDLAQSSMRAVVEDIKPGLGSALTGEPLSRPRTSDLAGPGNYYWSGFDSGTVKPLDTDSTPATEDAPAPKNAPPSKTTPKEIFDLYMGNTKWSYPVSEYRYDMVHPHRFEQISECIRHFGILYSCYYPEPIYTWVEGYSPFRVFPSREEQVLPKD